MTALPLKIAIDRTPLTEALFDGRVRSSRVKFDFVEVKPVTRAFRRMARDLEFDACEMSLATLAIATQHGIRLTGLPAPLLREYPLVHLVCLEDSPIHRAEDLYGKRIAVRAYSQTTAVWIRGLLENEFGVPASKVVWLTQEDSHVLQLGVQPHESPMDATLGLHEALTGGVADAAVTLHLLGKYPDIRTVVPDAQAWIEHWFAARQAQPINHLLVVQTPLLHQHPWLADELTDLFERARRAQSANGSDPAPWNPQGAAILLRFCAEQGLTSMVYTPGTLVDRG